VAAISAASVTGPATPSITKPSRCWNALMALLVFGPGNPSTRSVSRITRFKVRCIHAM
jgi:hypothetical protein